MLKHIRRPLSNPTSATLLFVQFFVPIFTEIVSETMEIILTHREEQTRQLKNNKTIQLETNFLSVFSTSHNNLIFYNWRLISWFNWLLVDQVKWLTDLLLWKINDNILRNPLFLIRLIEFFWRVKIFKRQKEALLFSLSAILRQ